jgi:hypothetical protein
MHDSELNSNAHYPGDGDIGLLTLNETLGYQTGWFRIGYNTDNDFYSGHAYLTMGYPGQNGYSGQDLYFQYGSIMGTVSGTSSYFDALQWSIDIDSVGA